MENISSLSPPREKLITLFEHYQNGRLIEAEILSKSITKEFPLHQFAWKILGSLFKETGRITESLDCMLKSVQINPQDSDAHNNYGVTLQELGRLDEAVSSYSQAIILEPDNIEAHKNLGNTFKDQGNLDKAIIAYNEAISINPDDSESHYNMGVTLKLLGKLEEAIASYTKAIELNPNYVEAHQNLSFVLLNCGKLLKGFDEYEWRWKKTELLPEQRQFVQPMWDGKQPLNGKRILIWCEQGIGDTIMWSSRLLLLASQSKHCILECQPKLVTLLKRSFPNVDVKVKDRRLDSLRDDFDFHLPMGSIYKNFIQELSKTDKVDAYLVPDLMRVDYWKDRLKSLGNGPFIGISWKSVNMSSSRLQNYAKISDLYPALKLPNVTFVNLQYTEFNDDLAQVQEELGVKVHNFNDLDHFNNIDDVAALCTALDMVVSTKTTVPLISAAVGTPTMLANWKQSPWNNLLLNPVGPMINIFERNTWESWDNIFKLIAKNIKNYKILK